MKLKLFLITFLLSMLLSTLLESIIAANNSQFGYFQCLMFLAYAFGGSFLNHLILFSLYYLFTNWLVLVLKNLRWLLLSIVFLAMIYIATILICDWNLSRPYYKNFSDYFSRGLHYPLYAFFVVLIVTPLKMLVIRRFRPPTKGG